LEIREVVCKDVDAIKIAEIRV